MGIEQKQTFRVTCDKRPCKNFAEYDSWLEVEKKEIATGNGFSGVWFYRFGPFQDLPNGWDYQYYSGYGSLGSYHFYCPSCSNQMKQEEIDRKEKAERDRARNLRKLERYKRVTTQ